MQMMQMIRVILRLGRPSSERPRFSRSRGMVGGGRPEAPQPSGPLRVCKPQALEKPSHGAAPEGLLPTLQMMGTATGYRWLCERLPSPSLGGGTRILFCCSREDLVHVCGGGGVGGGGTGSADTPQPCTPHYGSSHAITTLFFLSPLLCGPSSHDSLSSMRSGASSALFQKLTRAST